MLYKNLPKSVGLRRITLHKSCSPGPEVSERSSPETINKQTLDQTCMTC